MPKFIVTSDMLLNQMKRDSLRIAESFDSLCADDMAELSDLLAASATITLRGMYDEHRADKDLQILVWRIADQYHFLPVLGGLRASRRVPSRARRLLTVGGTKPRKANKAIC
jgi:hypothetical protein